MKMRNGFVSNSSSSSFVIISAGSMTLLEDGDTSMECCGGVTVDIDKMIALLQEAKDKGAKTVEISHGGGYEG
jgi:hypothetical protein